MSVRLCCLALCYPLLSGAPLAVRAAEPAALEEIIVSARKRDESLQETPISITSFSADSIDRRQILNVGDVSQYTPNMQFDQVSPNSGFANSASISIRGIGQTDFVLTMDPGVGIYLDGVYLNRAVGSLLDTVNVERIDVLRGPQGSLFGKNTLGGALLITSKRPGTQFSPEVSVTLGEFNRRDVKASLNVPVSSTFRLRLDGSLQKQDGYLDELITGDKEGDRNSGTARITALIEPSDRLEFFLSADYSKSDEKGPAITTIDVTAENLGLPGIWNTAFGDAVCADPANPARLANPTCFNAQWISPDKQSNFADAGNSSDVEVRGLSATVTYKGGAATLKSITAYREIEALSERDLDGTPLDIWDDVITYDQEQFSQELQLSGMAMSERLNWLLGAYYATEKGDSVDKIGGLFGIQSGGAIDNDSIAAFSQLTYGLTDRLKLTAGGRYTSEKKRWLPDQFIEEGSFFTFIWPAGTRLLPHVEDTIRAKEFTPMASLDFQFTKDVLGYVSYSEGFKGGGFTQRVFPPLEQIPSFKPEFARNYEVGFKSELWGRRLRLNGAIFSTDYTDLQVNVLRGFAPTVQNAGDASIDGAELEFEMLPTERFRLSGGIGYLDGKYDRIAPEAGPQPGLDGISADNELINTPKWSGTLSAAFDVATFAAGKLSAEISESYKSKMYKDAQNTAQLRSDDTALLDASLTFYDSDRRWAVSAGAKNLTDEKYLISGISNITSNGYLFGTFARGREWYFKVRYSP